MHAQNWKLGIALSLTTALMWGLLPLALLPIIGAVDYVTITFYRLGGGGCLLLVMAVALHLVQGPFLAASWD